jgi:hypothetical protein
MRNNGQNRDDDVPSSDSGLLMTTPRCGDDATTMASSYPPNVARSSGGESGITRTKADGGGTYPSNDDVLLNPDHARHLPALRLWPLAVLVFYSEFPIVYAYFLYAHGFFPVSVPKIPFLVYHLSPPTISQFGTLTRLPPTNNRKT